MTRRRIVYDANGNTLSDPSAKSYSWDFDNRLTQVVNPGVGTTTFRYDPFGRRIQKSGPLGTTNYLYDGLSSRSNVVEEVDNSGNVLARYTQSRNVDEPLSEVRSGTANYYEEDGLGSITSLSNSAGALSNTYTYDGFGKLIASTGTLTNPFRYTAREADSETSLYYYRARYFDPSAGRFVSEDPSGTSGGLNLYGYVTNDPINRYDPTGLSGSKPGSNAQFYICCQGGQTKVCDNGGSSNYSGWILDCMRQHEQQHVKDLTCGGKNPCQGHSDAPLTVPDATALECAAYQAQLQCMLPAPKTKEIDDMRAFIKKQIAKYCGGH
jgi:RHS repeat-associated protein